MATPYWLIGHSKPAVNQIPSCSVVSQSCGYLPFTLAMSFCLRISFVKNFVRTVQWSQSQWLQHCLCIVQSLHLLTICTAQPHSSIFVWNTFATFPYSNRLAYINHMACHYSCISKTFACSPLTLYCWNYYANIRNKWTCVIIPSAEPHKWFCWFLFICYPRRFGHFHCHTTGCQVSPKQYVTYITEVNTDRFTWRSGWGWGWGWGDVVGMAAMWNYFMDIE